MSSSEKETDAFLQEGLNMLHRGLDTEHIRENLRKRISDDPELDRIMNLIAQRKLQNRRARGGIVCIIAAVLLVFGCVFALSMNELSGATRFAIYAPSLIGSGLILWGFIDLLGW